jgi:acyl-CoA synthetase (AMP-forming)/AMP-acid ligase II
MYITQPLHRALQQYPNRLAVSYMGKKRTYKEYVDRVARLGGALQKIGMKVGDRVGMLSLNSDIYLEYQMGVVWGGGVLNPCNIRWSPKEIAYSLDDCDTKILIVDDTFLPLIEPLKTLSKSLEKVIYCGDNSVPEGMYSYEELLAETKPTEDALRSGDDLAGIFYTGGTTGFPKGVMLSHSNLYIQGLILSAEDFCTDNATYLHAAPMFHLADYGGTIGYWMRGSSHSIIPMFRPDIFLDAVEQDRVTHIILVPTMIQMLLDHPAMNDSRDFSSVLQVSYGASPISGTLVDRALKVFRRAGFVQAYGMTETAAAATMLKPYYHSEEGRSLGKLKSAGRPSCGVEVKIIDQQDNEVARNVVGEICIRGPVVMQGYWNLPEETEKSLRNGWMYTGDAGYVDDDGFVYIVDRLKDMIITGGENVYCAEVENAICAHKSVAMAAVIGIPSDQWGETVHAVVVLKPDANLTEVDLITHCRSLIAGYKCPKSVSFIDALPISGAGKILKTKLREPYWEGKSKKI